VNKSMENERYEALANGGRMLVESRGVAWSS
jgi:hypothetical protein